MGKHRKIKAVDPFCPAARRLPLQQDRNEKKKVNAKPKNLDDQEIPFKLRELMKMRKEMNEPKKKRKQHVGNKFKAGLSSEAHQLQPDIRVPKFKRRKSESVYNYIERMECETRHVMFLTHNQAVREPEKQQTVDAESQEPKAKKKKEFDKRRQEKLLKKKEEKNVDRLEKEMFEDRVEFGEVAMQPPCFTVKPRKGVGKVKPGERQLLLKNLFAQGSATSPKKKLPPASLARQRMMEEERVRVVQAYRALKKQRQLEQQLPPAERPAMDKLMNPK